MNKDELSFVVAVLEESLKPYRSVYPSHAELPDVGIERQAILDEMSAMADAERDHWSTGRASGAVYRGDEAHMEFMSDVYRLNVELNPLHPDLWPRATRYEAEVVSMTGSFLGADRSSTRNADGGVAGLMTSGGTDSILTAVRSARDFAAAERGVTRPSVVMPASAHPAFDKACQYFGLEAVRVPVGLDGKADVAAMEQAIDDQCAMVVGSAPSFPWGVIDPVTELAGMAEGRGVWFHTDACLGGFLLPFMAELGEPVPAFDFSVPGVTSISVDTHKYGYGAKGTSVLLFRNKALRRYSYFMTTSWAGGLYNSPTAAGSRPGALLAQAWAAMLSAGRQGYLDAAARIRATHKRIRDGLEAIGEIRVLGDSLFVLAFTVDGFDVYALQDLLAARGWNLTGLQFPAALHLAVTLVTTEDGVAGSFLRDVQDGVGTLRNEPERPSVMAPIYGLGQSLDTEVRLEDVLTGYLDVQFEV